MELITAIKAFPYAGRTINPGESVSVTDTQAKILLAIKVAKYQTKDVQIEDESEEVETKPKRRYVRRDMKADDE